MKITRKILNTVLALLLLLRVNAQVNYPTQGSYNINTTMGAFHGTWQWVNGTDTFKIYFATKKITMNVGITFYDDCLVGWHIYKKGNTIIESNWNYINNTSLYGFLGGNENQPIGEAHGYVKDSLKRKNAQVKAKLNAGQNQMTWKMSNTPGLKYRKPTDPPFERGFTLPANMVLTKL